MSSTQLPSFLTTTTIDLLNDACARRLRRRRRCGYWCCSSYCLHAGDIYVRVATSLRKLIIPSDSLCIPHTSLLKLEHGGKQGKTPRNPLVGRLHRSPPRLRHRKSRNLSCLSVVMGSRMSLSNSMTCPPRNSGRAAPGGVLSGTVNCRTRAC